MSKNFTEKKENDIIQKQHNTTIKHDEIFEPKEGQSGVLCCNKTSCGCPSLRYPSIEFTEDTINAFRELGEALLPVYKRLHSEGYRKVNGRLVKPDEKPPTNKSK